MDSVMIQIINICCLKTRRKHNMEMTAITAMEEKTISGKILLPEEYSWEQLAKIFPIVDSKKISHDDKLLRYEPKSLKEGFFKDELIKALRSNIPNFRAQALDPSFDRDGNIVYVPGGKPALEKSAVWWEDKAKLILSRRNSRLGSKNERLIFLGGLIIYLVEKMNVPTETAWKKIACNSSSLGAYASHETTGKLSPTGSKPIGPWSDLANTGKVLLEPENHRFYMTGGAWYESGRSAPLANIPIMNCPFSDLMNTVGWVVMDE